MIIFQRLLLVRSHRWRKRWGSILYNVYLLLLLTSSKFCNFSISTHNSPTRGALCKQQHWYIYCFVNMHTKLMIWSTLRLTVRFFCIRYRKEMGVEPNAIFIGNWVWIGIGAVCHLPVFIYFVSHLFIGIGKKILSYKDCTLNVQFSLVNIFHSTNVLLVIILFNNNLYWKFQYLVILVHVNKSWKLFV